MRGIVFEQDEPGGQITFKRHARQCTTEKDRGAQGMWEGVRCQDRGMYGVVVWTENKK